MRCDRAVGLAMFWVAPPRLRHPRSKASRSRASARPTRRLKRKSIPTAPRPAPSTSSSCCHDPGEAPTELACPSSPPSGYSVCAGPQDSGALPTRVDAPGGERRASPSNWRAPASHSAPEGSISSESWSPIASSAKTWRNGNLRPWSVERRIHHAQPALGRGRVGVERVTAMGATLGAEVNLHGVTAGAFYQFQLATDRANMPRKSSVPRCRSRGFRAVIGTQEPGRAADRVPSGERPSTRCRHSHASLDPAAAGLDVAARDGLPLPGPRRPSCRNRRHDRMGTADGDRGRPNIHRHCPD